MYLLGISLLLLLLKYMEIGPVAMPAVAGVIVAEAKKLAAWVVAQK